MYLSLLHCVLITLMIHLFILVKITNDKKKNTMEHRNIMNKKVYELQYNN